LAPEEHVKRRSKRGSTRSRDNGAFDAGESNGADGIDKGDAVERARWWVIRVNPNAPPCDPPPLLYSCHRYPRTQWASSATQAVG
jgi:hypothetical protein